MLRAEGLFGPIAVQQNDRTTALLINGQTQGMVFNTPGAESVCPDLAGPGPVSACAYTSGWWLGACSNPGASCLMIGLGAGAGVTAVLSNFPDIDITVVEIDPALVDLALRGFPLLEYYLDQGRLNIVVEDAQKYISRSHDLWDLGLADAYTGKNKLVDDYIPLMARRCKQLVLNVIGSLGDDNISSLCRMFQQLDIPVQDLMKATTPGVRSSFESMGNWALVAGAPIDYEVCDRFIPHHGELSAAAWFAQRTWEHLLRSSVVDTAGL